MEKICSKCKILKDLDLFSNDKSRKDGKQRTCKNCHKLYSVDYEKMDKCKSYRKEYKKGDKYKDRAKEYRKIYTQTEDYKLMAKISDSKPERRYFSKLRSTQRRRLIYALKNNTTNELTLLFEIQNNSCLYCDEDISEKFQLDHIMPLSKGGSNLITNICLCCDKCNMNKSSKTTNIWFEENNKDHNKFEQYLINRNSLFYKEFLEEE